VVHVTAETVHEILGLPIGEISLYDLPERREDDEFVQLWLSQFAPKRKKRIFATDIAEKYDEGFCKSFGCSAYSRRHQYCWS
nr:ubiquitin-specific protease 13 [Tanacetum cinerariifolium]